MHLVCKALFVVWLSLATVLSGPSSNNGGMLSPPDASLRSNELSADDEECRFSSFRFRARRADAVASVSAARRGDDEEDDLKEFKEDRVGGYDDGEGKRCTSFLVSVLTLNLWDSLANTPQGSGVKDLVETINYLRADVVVLQDVNQKTLKEIMKLLGPSWKSTYGDPELKKSVAILSNLGFEKIYAFSPIGKYQEAPPMQGVKISRGPLGFRVFNAHFTDLALPDVIRHIESENKSKSSRKKATNEFMAAVEKQHQRTGIYPAMAGFVNAAALDPKIPTLFAGTLNMPSHLDQNPETRPDYVGARGLSVTIFDWPVSKQLEKAGFVDTYRQQHTDPTLPENYGFTYPDLKIDKNAVFDRLDYIYARDSVYQDPKRKEDTWTIVSSDIIRKLPAADQQGRAWISNHLGVFTVLRLNSGEAVAKVFDKKPKLLDII